MILSKTSFFEEGDCFACIQEEGEIDAANSTVLRKVEGSADRLPMLKGCCFPAALTFDSVDSTVLQVPLCPGR